MLYLVLPAFNEEKDIAALLSRVGEAGIDCRVIVVNDGSTDGTASAARRAVGKLPVEILEHDGNKGLGQAILTGLSRGAELADEDDIVVTMDADNTHDPALIGMLAEEIRAGKDLVIASRYANGGEEVGLAPVRRILSRGASALLKIFFPIPGARDYTCGYRAYRGALLHQAFRAYGPDLVQEHGFTCMAELLIKMSKLGIQVGEAPLVLRYDLKTGASKMKFARTIARYFVLIARNRFQPAPAPLRVLGESKRA